VRLQKREMAALRISTLVMHWFGIFFFVREPYRWRMSLDYLNDPVG
jgi:hypothetical protein